MAEKLGPLMFFMSKGGKGDRACLGAANGLDVLGLNYASSRYDEDVKHAWNGHVWQFWRYGFRPGSRKAEA